uniref:PGG domain-containing protein n=2 Tax=Zea mays TaxID=4577 RepID=A0A804MW35_MAIZE
MVRALLRHPDIDLTVINNRVNTAIWNMYNDGDEVKTINWNKIYLLIRNADRRAKNDIYNFREEIRNKVNYATRKDAKSLIQTYTTNTSLVAILLATITFAAAFTLPGGYSSDAGSE